jgi:sugar lactone lactonase YvrE
MAFIRNVAAGDHAAIEWLNRNAGGDDVVLECCQNEYDWPGRISSFTGISTLMAWDNSHEGLWRSGQPELRAEVGRRRQVVNAIYQGTDPDAGGSPLTPAKLLEVLGEYSVDYVVVGAVERGQIPGRSGVIAEGQRVTAYAESVMRAANMQVAFQSGNTVIYAVEGAQAGPDVVVPTPVGGPSPVAGTVQFDPNVPPIGMFERGGAGPNRGQLNLPRGIARDSEGNFYVADTENKRIQKFDAEGNWLLMFGSRGGDNGQFAAITEDSVGTGPGGLAVDAEGNVYVADTWNHRIQKFNSEGQFTDTWGSFISLADATMIGELDANSRFYGPRGVAIGPDGNVYVTDTGNKRVLIFDKEGSYLRQIESGLTEAKIDANYPFNAPGELNEPVGIAVDAEGNVYVADTNNRRIQKFDGAGEPVAQWPVSDPNWAPGPYLEPFLSVDAVGNVYATAPSGRSVLKFSAGGELLGQKNSTENFTLNLPTGISVDADGEVYVVDTNGHAVVRLGAIP